MPRGMSKCRRCGKKVPSIYRPYHEKVACKELKRMKGLLKEPRKPRIEENTINHKLLEWVKP